jgi:molybdate transport system substrate-binding protein
MGRLLLAVLFASVTGFAQAEPLRIAVAANFQDTFEALVAAYAKQSPERIEGSYGATGMLYTQISNGAPFAALFAADGDRTAQLVADGRAKAASRFVYAIGRLALWTPGAASPPPTEWLADEKHRVAIANPELAPYGLAAKQTLTSMKLWDQIQPRLVTGNSVAQTMQFIATGAAPGGFVAQAQLIAHYKGTPPSAEVWVVPLNMHSPIVQEAVVLNTPDADRAQAFLTFVASDAGRTIIEAGGYAVLAPTH